MDGDIADELRGILYRATFASMVPDFILKEAKRLQDAIVSPESKEEWLERRERIRARVLHSFGLTASIERPPLKPQVRGVLQKEGYSIEKVVFESRPGIPVAGHLYLPDKIRGRQPAVIHIPGHNMENGKMADVVQISCAALARLGFVAFTIDPMGQGERRTGWHNHGQLAPRLVGLSQIGMLVWECSRAVDYLVSRSEVDSERIGITGASGGGLQSMWAPVFDERIACVAAVCCPNHFLNLLIAIRWWNWNGGIDLCNQVPQALSYARQGDIIGLVAPRPFLIITALQDNQFPIAGAREVFEQAKHIYHLLGSDEVALAEVDDVHGYNQEMREIAYGWFSQKLMSRGDGGPIAEPKVELSKKPYEVIFAYATADHRPETRQTLVPDLSLDTYCFDLEERTTPDPLFVDWARERAKTLPPIREIPETEAAWTRLRGDLLKEVKSILGPWPERKLFGYYNTKAAWPPETNMRIINEERTSFGWAERIELDSEPGITLETVLLLPDEWEKAIPIIVFLHDKGKFAALRTGIPEILVRQGYGVYLMDLRGTGESVTCEFENVTNAWMLDRDWFSYHVWDITRAVDYLSGRVHTGKQLDKQRIFCWGYGLSALEIIYAAAVDDRISGVIVQGSPVSYKSLLVLRPKFPIGAFSFDVLSHFEIAQVASILAPRPVFVANPVDGHLQSVSSERLEAEFAWCRTIYQLLGVDDGRLTLSSDPAVTLEQCQAWLDRWMHND